MRNRLTLLLIVTVLLASLLPVSVFAAEPVEVEVTVRNSTGAEVNIDLVDANGNHMYKTLEAGISKFDLMEGVYNYYAQTTCGNIAGTLNMNVSKILYLDCNSNNAAVVQLNKSCKYYIDFGDNTYMKANAIWSRGPYFDFSYEALSYWMDINGYQWACLDTVLPEDMSGQFKYGYPWW